MQSSRALLDARGAAGDLLLRLDGGAVTNIPFDDTVVKEGGLRAGARAFGYDVATIVTPCADARGFDVETTLTALAPLRVVSLLHSVPLPFATPLDDAWMPALRRRPSDVAADHVFRSPALIARRGTTQIALVPRLDPHLWEGPLGLSDSHFEPSKRSERVGTAKRRRKTGDKMRSAPPETQTEDCCVHAVPPGPPPASAEGGRIVSFRTGPYGLYGATLMEPAEIPLIAASPAVFTAAGSLYARL